MSTWVVSGYTESLELGSGVSGRVVLAVHADTGVRVAVKYLSESLRRRPGFLSGRPCGPLLTQAIAYCVSARHTVGTTILEAVVVLLAMVVLVRSVDGLRVLNRRPSS